MTISPFSSIFFLGSRKTDGVECPYIQTFGRDDNVLVQTIRTSEEQQALPALVNVMTGTTNTGLIKTSHTIGDSVVECFEFCADYMTLPDGYYYMKIGDEESETFRITSNENELKDTVLIEYSYGENRNRRDVLGYASGQRIWFSFRVPGGFKSGGRSYSIDNEQFVTQTSDIVELYSLESVQEILTMGTNEGAPIWFGDLLNRLLTCKYVYIDKKRYVRYQSSVPEFEQPLASVNSFIFTQKLQRIKHIEPTKQ